MKEETPPITSSVFELEGYINSLELSEKTVLLHQRQGHVQSQMKAIQADLHELPKAHPERPNKVKLLNGYISEQTKINSMLKEYSILRKLSIDQLMLSILEDQHYDIFSSVLEKAKSAYHSKHKKH